MYLLVLFDDFTPILFNCLVQIFFSFSLYILVVTRFSNFAGILSVLFFYSTPNMIILLSTGKPDGIFFGIIFLSFHFLLLWKEKNNLNYLYLSSIFVGASLALKYQAIYWFFTIYPIFIIIMLLNKNVKNFFILALYFGIIPIIISCPWYLKNFITTGDPVWPFGYSLFESSFWNAELDTKYKSWETGPGKSLLKYLFGFWNLTLRQAEWKWGLLIPFLPYNLILLPGLALTYKRFNKKQIEIIIFCLLAFFIFYSIWFIGWQQIRYLLPVMGLLNLISAAVLVHLYQSKNIRILLRMTFASILIFSLSYSIFYNSQFLKNALGLESKKDFLTNKISFYEDISFLNENLNDDAVVLWNDLKAFYCEKEWVLIPQFMYDSFNSDLFVAVQFLKGNNITHIFNPYHKTTELIINELVDNNFIKPIYENNFAKIIGSRSLGNFNKTNLVIYEVNKNQFK